MWNVQKRNLVDVNDSSARPLTKVCVAIWEVATARRHLGRHLMGDDLGASGMWFVAQAPPKITPTDYGIIKKILRNHWTSMHFVFLLLLRRIFPTGQQECSDCKDNLSQSSVMRVCSLVEGDGPNICEWMHVRHFGGSWGSKETIRYSKASWTFQNRWKTDPRQ